MYNPSIIFHAQQMIYHGSSPAEWLKNTVLEQYTLKDPGGFHCTTWGKNIR